jgi:tetratricopeptide (TPR) repeat protein
MKLNLLTKILFFVFLIHITRADELADKMDKIVNEYNDIGMFSGNVLIAKDGGIIYQKQFGFSDWEKKTPVTNETLFRIGSLNKMFTHAIIKQLEGEGKLNLNDNLGKYLKLYNDERDNKITINMLLEMKAGLGDYLDDPAYIDNIEDMRTVDDFLAIIKDEPLLFEPDSSMEYSNSGYVVLGGIIEKVTGMSYPDNLKRRFLEPLGMTNTFYLLMGETKSNMASGTRINFSGGKSSSNFPEQPSPAGGMYSTAEDLLKFTNELIRSGLVPPGIRAGGTPVWNSILAQFKDGYTIIINSNFGQVADGIIDRLIAARNGKEYPKPDVTLQMKMYEILERGGTTELEASLKEVLGIYGMHYNDRHLNMFGYELMNNDKLNEAIEVFKLNVKLFPDAANTYDSLAEAYMNAGNNKLAAENYRKVLELQPENTNAKKMLEKLGN